MVGKIKSLIPSVGGGAAPKLTKVNNTEREKTTERGLSVLLVGKKNFCWSQLVKYQNRKCDEDPLSSVFRSSIWLKSFSSASDTLIKWDVNWLIISAFFSRFVLLLWSHVSWQRKFGDTGSVALSITTLRVCWEKCHTSNQHDVIDNKKTSFRSRIDLLLIINDHVQCISLLYKVLL